MHLSYSRSEEAQVSQLSACFRTEILEDTMPLLIIL